MPISDPSVDGRNSTQWKVALVNSKVYITEKVKKNKFEDNNHSESIKRKAIYFGVAEKLNF